MQYCSNSNSLYTVVHSVTIHHSVVVVASSIAHSHAAISSVHHSVPSSISIHVWAVRVIIIITTVIRIRVVSIGIRSSVAIVAKGIPAAVHSTISSVVHHAHSTHGASVSTIVWVHISSLIAKISS